MPKKKKEVVKPEPKLKYPKVLDEIEFDVKLGVTHHDNPENNGYSRGEHAMLEKVKEALSK